MGLLRSIFGSFSTPSEEETQLTELSEIKLTFTQKDLQLLKAHLLQLQSLTQELTRAQTSMERTLNAQPDRRLAEESFGEKQTESLLREIEHLELNSLRIILSKLLNHFRTLKRLKSKPQGVIPTQITRTKTAR